jgi:tetratricopeptide (TPR) repeat protein
MDFIGESIALARELEAKGELPAAVGLLSNLLHTSPGHREVLIALSRLSARLALPADALALLDMARAAGPADRALLLERASLLERSGDVADALATLRDLADGDDPTPHLRLGYVQRRQLAYDAALRNNLMLTALHPEFAAGWVSLGIDFHTKGDLTAAATCFHRALALEPANPVARFSQATALLAAGQWQQGFAEFAWRRSFPDAVPAPAGLPEWRGRGKAVLLWNDQGLGDAIQFLRYVPEARRRGLDTVLLVPKTLLRLARSAPGIGTVVGLGEKLPDIDGHLPLMDLPARLGLGLLPADTPYLRADDAAAQRWRERLAAADGLKVGLVRAGASRAADFQAHKLDQRRSLSAQALMPILSVGGARFVSLQMGGSWDGVDDPFKPYDAMTEITDFADTAALVEALDLVISVDTSVAHLAGALGKPVWILSRYDGCWRWLRDRDDCPWYRSARLFRQQRPGDWGPAVAEVAAALGALVRARL